MAAALAISCGSLFDHPETERSTRVDSNGVTLMLDELTVTGQAGVAPLDTELTARVENHQFGAGSGQDMLVPLSSAYRLELAQGQEQPATPLTVTFEVDPEETGKLLDEGKHLVVIAQSGGSEELDYYAATFNGADAVTADIPHLSMVQLFGFDIGKFFDDTKSAIANALGIRFPKPSCVGKTVDYATIQVKINPVSDDVAWPCLVGVKYGLEGHENVELYSNSPYLWEVRGTPEPRDVYNSVDSIDSYVPGAFYQRLIGNYSDRDAFLLPGNKVTLEFGQYHLSAQSVALSKNIWISTVAMFGHAVAVVASKLSPKKYQQIVEDATAMECLSQVGKSFNQLQSKTSADNFGKLAREVLGCLSLVIGGSLFSFVVGGVGGMVGGWLVDLFTGKGRDSASATVETANTPGATPADCGLITLAENGKQARVVISTTSSTVQCTEAVDVVDRFLSIRERSASFNGWECGILGAGQADREGHFIKCVHSGRSAELTVSAS